MAAMNKYLNLFSQDMTPDEARFVFYSHTDGLSSKELALLQEAYSEVSKKLLRAELAQVNI